MKDYNSILVVEDDLVFCKILTNYLNKNGFHAEDSQSAEVALSRIESGEIDLVVADYKLPDSNGMDLLNRIQSISPKTDVILMSRYERDSIQSENNFPEGLIFLRKPFGPQELIRMIYEVSKR